MFHNIEREAEHRPRLLFILQQQQKNKKMYINYKLDVPHNETKEEYQKRKFDELEILRKITHALQIGIATYTCKDLTTLSNMINELEKIYKEFHEIVRNL